MVCPLVKLDKTLEYKFRVLSKHLRIVENLKREIEVIESEKRFTYFQMMGGKGVY